MKRDIPRHIPKSLPSNIPNQHAHPHTDPILPIKQRRTVHPRQLPMLLTMPPYNTHPPINHPVIRRTAVTNTETPWVFRRSFVPVTRRFSPRFVNTGARGGCRRICVCVARARARAGISAADLAEPGDFRGEALAGAEGGFDALAQFPRAADAAEEGGIDYCCGVEGR